MQLFIAGGVNPSFSVESNRVAMEDLLDRTEADMRGVKLSSDTQHTKHNKKNMVMAGEANKKGGIYDRLSDQKSYTGVRFDCMHHTYIHTKQM